MSISLAIGTEVEQKSSIIFIEQTKTKCKISYIAIK